MDFDPTTAQRDLGALTREILTDRVSHDRLRQLEDKGEPFDRSLWTDLAASGVLAATLPSTAGGDGYAILERCTILAELGRAVAPVPYLASIVTAAGAVARFGDSAQVDRWAAPAGRGELVLTAALDGSPVDARRTTGGGWVLTGSRSVVPAAPYADLILVPAGDAVFLVTPADDGVSVRPQRVAGGAGEGWLELTNVELPGDRVLGEVGAGVETWMRMNATVGICAAQLGVTERALELTAEYARTRVQFGRAIGTFQAVTQRLADAYIDVEAIRLTLWQAAWRLATGLPCETEVATAKFWAADAGHRVAHTAVHIHGGVGIDLDHPLHRYFLAAKYHEFTLGAATTHLLNLGHLLAGQQIRS
jgi:alkylation response protein AidB-like acyl-CoA dehydrogenase